MTQKGYTQGLYIDNVFFDIPFISIKRNADFLEKFAERNEAGTVIMETIGVYLNYTVNIGTVDDKATYEALFNTLINPKQRMHNVRLPDGTSDFTFRGYFSSISDEVEKVLEHDVEFKGLTFKMTSENPNIRG